MANYDFLNQRVITSLLCFQRDADSFFAPVPLKHTGFAYDGYYYAAGTKDPHRTASWFNEAQSSTRGPLPEFPTQVLAVVNRASLALLDATTKSLALWMLFYFGDQLALCDNTQGQAIGYLASTVTWHSGLLTVVLSPDPGADTTEPLAVTFDFTQDAVYADTAQGQEGPPSQ